MTTTQDANIPSIKVEGDALIKGQEPRIKPDPEALRSSPGVHSDEDIYEDTGDLDFTNADQAVHLVRIPKELWETWSKLDDNHEIEVGRIRLEGGQDDIKRVSGAAVWTLVRVLIADLYSLR